MKIIYATDPKSFSGLNTAQLREGFLVSGLFRKGEAVLCAWETERTLIGGAVPTDKPLGFSPERSVVAGGLFDRREAGIINIGGAGTVTIDGQAYSLAPRDGLYVGRGAKEVSFQSKDAAKPAAFYFLSYPAHTSHPICHVPFASVKGDELGSPEKCNKRTLYKYFHPGAMPTCQLVMGMTMIASGSAWNTMPPHTHWRRSEVYLYFDIAEGEAVFHLLGQPTETRHLVMHDREVALSPVWSVHSGVGTANYAFIWGMGGENQEFSDMDPAPIATLR